MTTTLKTQTTKQDYSKTSTMWQASKDKTTRPCIWMQSGVVAKKNCNHYFDCNSCKYDTAMQKAVSAGKQISWQDAMRMRDSTDRTCRHAITGRADHRICPMNYNCQRCDFDQMFEETISTGTSVGAVAMNDVKYLKLQGLLQRDQDSNLLMATISTKDTPGLALKAVDSSE